MVLLKNMVLSRVGLFCLSLSITVTFEATMVGFVSPVEAGVLGAPANCQTLRAQRSALVVLGVKKNMAQGALWAKQNLPEPELYLIRHYMKIDEKVRFRCAVPVQKVAKQRRKKRKKRRNR